MARARPRGRALWSTEGHRLLAVVVKREGQMRVADAIGVAQQTVSYYARRLARPGDEVRARIAAHYGIPPEAFRTSEEISKEA